MTRFAPPMTPESRVYVAGHRGLVGGALVRTFQARGFSQLLVRTSTELDLREQQAVRDFFTQEQPE